MPQDKARPSVFADGIDVFDTLTSCTGFEKKPQMTEAPNADRD